MEAKILRNRSFIEVSNAHAIQRVLTPSENETIHYNFIFEKRASMSIFDKPSRSAQLIY